jgi:hypothetical protein
MIEALILWLLDGSHCARWVDGHDRGACADVRLDADRCTTVGWHRFGWQQIYVCRTGCGTEGPSS